jgi:diguanylate cyclase (GGDEF)-like protein
MRTRLRAMLEGQPGVQLGVGGRRSFAARVFSALLLIGVLPMLVAGVVGFVAVSTHLTASAFAALQASSKNYGQSVVQRLDQAQLGLRALEREVAAGERLDGSVMLAERMEAVFVIDDAGTVRQLVGSLPKPTFVERLRTSRTQLVWDGDRPAHVALLHRMGDGRRLVAIPRAETLWGDVETLPYGMQICVLSARSLVPLYCPGAPATEIVQHLAGNAQQHGAHFEVPTASGDALGAANELFLGQFQTEQGWLIVATLPEDIALQAVRSFRASFPALILLVALCATMLGLREIRRRTAPLDQLIAATERITRSDFEHDITLAGNDEFETLGEHFNQMNRHLRQSFGTLRAMAQVDQGILSEPNIVAVAEKVLRHCVQGLGAPQALLLLAQRRDHRQPGASAGAQLFSLSAGASMQQLALESTSALPLEITVARAGELPMPPHVFEHHARHVWSLPIWQQDRAAGWLLLASDSAEISPRADLNELAQRVAVALDVLDARDHLHERANFDSLTGLPNRQFFRELLSGAVIRARRRSSNGALMFIDLDNFKFINDSEGHRAGDDVLREVANRLTQTLRATDTVARLGGDEFTVILEDVQRPSDISRMAENLIAAVSKPIRSSHAEVTVSASIGITLFPEDADDVETLLVNADLAMYRVKETGRNGVRFFSEDMNARVHERKTIESRLRTALRVGGFTLAYQPQIDARSGQVIGAEALLRWHDSELGQVSPARFIPIAEDTGLIVDIGHWILRQICADYVRWKAGGIAPPRVAMNVSQRQFATPTFVRDLLETLATAHMDASDLELEVTESMLARDVELVWQKLSQLRQGGVHIALDDFGTGYSSLNLLRRLPVDIIKIDKSFIDDVDSSPDAQSIVTAISAMSHALDKALVAEGVETEAQVEFLRGIGCHVCQGYLFSKPMSAEDLANYMRVRQAPALAASAAALAAAPTLRR